MTRFTDIKAALTAMGLTIRRKDGEYRVAYAGKGNEASAYYTNDLEDAFGTGKHMAKEAAIIRAKKNPAKRPAFGKKKAAKLRALPTKDHRKKRTAHSRREAIIAMRNPSLGSHASRFVVRAVANDGKIFYFNGISFEDRKKSAAIFDHKRAEEVMTGLENQVPSRVKYLDVVQA